MNLFKTLSEVLGNGCTATITIAQKDGIMTVGVLPGNNLVKDSAKNKIVPLNVSGTPEELDEGFVDAIAEPVRKTAGLLVDMAAYEQAAEEAKAKSKMEEEKKIAEANRKKDYDGYVNLARTNLKEQKYRDALKCVESARKVALPSDKTALDTLTNEINSASGEGALFGPSEDKSDGKNISLNAPKGKKDKPASSECESDCETSDEEEE